MSIALLPANEVARLQSLRDLRVLDTGPEEQFDALVKVASLVCGVPISLISLIDAERQWFKANIGLPGTSQTPRDLAFCAHAILGDTIFEVSDAALDPRFSGNPLVTDYPDIRFYAGAPVRLSSGECVGTLCVIDRQPRRLDAQQRDILTQLACAAARALEGRRAMAAERHLLDAQAHVNSLLRESEALLDRTGRLAGVGGWAIDLVSNALSWSGETCRILGVEPGYPLTIEKTIGFYAPEARPLIQAAIDKGMRSGEGWDLELPLIQASGRRIWTRSVGAIDFCEGVPVRLVGVNWDVSNLRELSLELERKEQMLRSVTDSLPMLVSYIDPQQRYRFANQTYAAWYGRPVEDMVGRRVADVLPASTWAKVAPHLQAALQGTASVHENELTVLGQQRDLRVQFIPQWGQHQEVEGVVTVISDISEYKAIEQTLRKSKNSLKQAQAIAHIGSWEYEISTEQFFCSEEAYRIFGVEPGSVVRHVDFLSQLVHPDDRKKSLSAHWSALQKSKRFETDYRIVRADGDIRYLLHRIERSLDEAGQPAKLAGVVIDVTQRKLGELALEAARERELAIGYSVQQSLLMADVPSELNGAWITAYTEPSQGLHGDFIAVSQISSTRFSLLIGDVMGKGVHAAMIGAGVKNAYYQVLAELTAQTLASQALPSAEAIINALHARMTPKLIEMNSFVTLALYAFDIEAGTLTVVNAGHTPALLARAGSGPVEMIVGSNLPIGVLTSEIYAQHVVHIAVNDQLVIYSDGISEVRNRAGEEFGEAGISAWLTDVGAADVPQAAALNTLRQALADFGGPQRVADDQTVLMVRLRPHDLPVRQTPTTGHNPDYLTLPMRLGALPALRTRLAQVTAQWPRAQADELILATYEAATNTIRHTPASLPEAYLACRFTTDPDSLCVEFFYPGAPVVLDEARGPDFSGASESGFGLYIMREFLDQVEYGVPVEGMVSVRLRKRLTPPQA